MDLKFGLPKILPLFLKKPIVSYSPKLFFETLKKNYYLRPLYEVADFR